jgi:hypothetical protein
MGTTVRVASIREDDTFQDKRTPGILPLAHSSTHDIQVFAELTVLLNFFETLHFVGIRWGVWISKYCV